MDRLAIALNKLNAVVMETPLSPSPLANRSLVLTLNAHLMSLGYMLAQPLLITFMRLPASEVIPVGGQMIQYLRERQGSHVQHQPMYANFPQQVIEMSCQELYMNALMHYYTCGYWQPDYAQLPREFAFEQVKFQSINQISETQFRALFSTLLQSQDSLSAQDKAIIEWFLQHEAAKALPLPEEIPFHENRCLVAAHWLKMGQDITPLIKTSTDILRLATYLSHGDVSLADNTKFRSLPRALRRRLLAQLTRVINEEDIGRHRNKWVRLFHNLHVGDYSSKLFKIAQKVRNGEPLQSFYAQLEAALSQQDVTTAIRLLRTRPGEFGRRLDHVMRIAQTCDQQSLHPTQPNANVAPAPNTNQQQTVINAFVAVVDAIPTRNLLQLLGHLQTRFESIDQRVVFPKGSLQKAVVVKHALEALNPERVNQLRQGIMSSLSKRFANLPALGKVWLDPALMDCPLPSQQRSASSGLFSVARGTRFPLGYEQDTLRLFVYWVGMDIDLSATFHAADGSVIEQVSYTQLRSASYQAFHSGDITRAPNGASEFIDIHLPSAAQKAHYLAMNVLVFNGPTFAEHSTCFVGWMLREYPGHNALYEPSTVKQKLDLRQACSHVLPVVFDLQERKAIWMDLPIPSNAFYHSVNNVENHRASITQKLNAILHMHNRLSLYDLFYLHAQARGTIVTDKAKADTIFSLEEGITPFHVNNINADYMI